MTLSQDILAGTGGDQPPVPRSTSRATVRDAATRHAQGSL